MNMKKFLVYSIAGILIFAVAFNARTIARFSKQLDPMSQIISAITFDVKTDNTLKDRDAKKPGDLIAKDTITLKNENDYDVEFIIKLTAENINETEFIKYLNLSILDGENILEANSNEYKVQVPKKTEKVVTAKVDWKTDENGEIDAVAIEGGSVRYTYDIVAKQIITTNSENNNTNIIVKSFTTEADIEPWKGVAYSNPSQVRVLDSNSMIVKKEAYTEIAEYRKLNEGEMITIKSTVEFTGNTNAEEGFVYSLMMTNDYSIKANRYTSSVYKKNGFIYGSVKMIENPTLPGDVMQVGSKTTKTEFVLINEIYKSGQDVYCNMIIEDKEGNVIKKLTRSKHKDNDSYKLYASFSNLIGISGIRVKEIEIKYN